MGKAIVWALLILVTFGAWSWLCFHVGAAVAKDRIIRAGGAGQQGVDLIKQAFETFTEQMHPSTIFESGSYDMLSERTSKKVQAWLQAYNKWRGKVR